jgi:sulfoxide reductase heme-binding subunit YedZ
VNPFLASKWTRAAVFALCLAPLGALLWFGITRNLTANPLEYITHYTGDWTLRFFMFTLAVTPLRTLLRRPVITRYRRVLGLFTFFYGSLHLLTWMWFDRQFAIAGMWEDIVKRAYITAGMGSFLAMVPLAATSTSSAVRRLGYARWRRLHRLIYPAAALGVLHYLWLVKSDIREPLLYGGIWAALMATRGITWLWNSRR